MKIMNLLLYVAALTLFSCGEDDEDKNSIVLEEVTDFFLTTSEMNKTSTETQSTSEFRQGFLASSEFFKNEPEGDEDENDKCLDEKTNEAMQITGEGENLTVSFHVSVLECMPENENLTMTSSTLKVYAEFTCGGADLSDITGIDLDELDKLSSRDCTSITKKIHSTAGFEGVSTSDGVTTDISFVANSVTGEDAETPCTDEVSTEFYTSTDCVDRSVTTTTFVSSDNREIPDSVSTEEWSSNALARLRNSEAPYYNSGTWTGEVDNWEFTVTYTDANTAPTWEATNGTETIDGTFTP